MNDFRSQIRTQPKDKNLDYLIHSTLKHINRLFVQLFQAGKNE